jgi:hypothetical protein
MAYPLRGHAKLFLESEMLPFNDLQVPKTELRGEF